MCDIVIEWGYSIPHPVGYIFIPIVPHITWLAHSIPRAAVCSAASASTNFNKVLFLYSGISMRQPRFGEISWKNDVRDFGLPAPISSSFCKDCNLVHSNDDEECTPSHLTAQWIRVSPSSFISLSFISLWGSSSSAFSTASHSSLSFCDSTCTSHNKIRSGKSERVVIAKPFWTFLHVWNI